jgi:hypothetical protein
MIPEMDSLVVAADASIGAGSSGLAVGGKDVAAVPGFHVG